MVAARASIIVFIFLLPLTSIAQSEDNRWFKWSLAFFVSSQRVFRGAVFSRYPAAAGGPAFTFFNHLQVRGPNLAWTVGGRKDSHAFEIGSRFINDGAGMFSLGSGDDGYRESRADALEGYFNYSWRFGWRNLFGLNLSLVKEFIRHEGEYASVGFKVPVFMYTSLTSTWGVGSRSHNLYVYGEGAQSGPGHHDLTLSYVIPQLPWKGIIMFLLTQSWVLQHENQQAGLVRGHDKQFAASTRWIWSF